MRRPSLGAASLRPALYFFAALGLAWLAWGLFKPLRNDDVLWAYTGQATLEQGLPQVRYGLDQVHLGLWHPPLFQYELALFFRVFGNPELSTRLPGLLGVLLCLGLGAAYLRRKGLPSRVPVFALGLLLGVPLTQGALVPDIDGALLAPLLLAAAWALDEALTRGGWRPWAWIAVLSGLSLACKWTTPPILFGFWLGLTLLHPAWRGAFPRLLAALAAGGLMFAAVYLGWCAWARVSPLYPFEFSFLNKAAAGAAGLQLKARGLSLFYGVTAAAGPGILAAAAGAWLARPRGRHAFAGLLLLSGALLLLAYSLLFPGFTPMGLTFKYLAPASAFFALGLALLWDGSGPAIGRRGWAGIALLMLALPFLHALAAPWHDHSPRRLGLGWLLLLALAVFFWRRRRGTLGLALREAGLTVACLQAALFYGLGLREPADSSPSYPTVERGFSELLRQPPEGLRGSVLLAQKEVTFYLSPRRGIPASPWFAAPAQGWRVPLESRPLARRFARHWPGPVDDTHYYPAFELAYAQDAAGLKALLAGPVEAVVESEHYRFITGPELRALLDARFPRKSKIGDFSIHQRGNGGRP